MLSNSNNPLEQPTLSHLLWSSYETNQDNLSLMTGNKHSINKDQVQIDGLKIDPNPINPILPSTPNPINDVAIELSKKYRRNHMKME